MPIIWHYCVEFRKYKQEEISTLSGLYAKKDIYDENGILILSKGKQLTPRIIKKLINRGSYELSDIIKSSSQDNDKAQADIISESFKTRKNILNNRTLEKSSEIISRIIFKCRTKPWWIYVNALSNYVDWLYTHSIDVAIMSLMMAIELGYNDEELKKLGLASLLHDVGILLVPKQILEKDSELTKEELAYIRQHCKLGASSLQGFNFSNECIDVVLQHHERLDGSGYPRGLKDMHISQNAKIVMIADAVDAITSYHPSGKPKDLEDAIRRLREVQEKYSQGFVDLLEDVVNKNN